MSYWFDWQLLSFFFQITELVHQRDMTRQLAKNKINSTKSFDWLRQMRFYFDPKNSDVLQQLSIHMANAKFNYGFEYLGVQDKLVQTPLTDRCYLTMTQALEARLGGSPFGRTCFHLVCIQISQEYTIHENTWSMQNTKYLYFRYKP